MYDSIQQAWINTTIDKVLGTFVGATADFAGLPGLVPGPAAGKTNAFLRSDGTWTEIAGVSHNITSITNDTNQKHSDIMNNLSAVTDDILIIKDIIAEDKYQYTAYVHNGTNWEAMDGNYDAENVYFKNDFIFTEAIGSITIPSSGNTVVPAAGKNIVEFLSSIFVQEEAPMISPPYAEIVLNNINNTYEVGSSYTPGYTIYLNRGTYSYDESTGVTEVRCSVEDTIGSPISNEWSKLYDTVTITDDFRYEVKGTVTYSDGNIPHTNLGNPYLEGQIKSKTIDVKTKNAVTGYRKGFYGTFSDKIEQLTSNEIRTLPSSEKALTNNTSFLINIPVGAKRVVIAYPSYLRDLTSVKDVNALNTDIVSSFRKEFIDVEGFNGYKAKPYKVYILDYAFGAIVPNSYYVTI